MTDAQLQTELASQITAGILPQPLLDGAGNTNTAYMVHFPPNVKLSAFGINSCVQFCAYHNTATLGASNTPLPYGAIMDYFTSACSLGCGSNATALENTTSVSSHELSELVTDTDIGLDTQNAYAYPAAWGDNNNNCGEIADICDDGSGSTITISGRSWIVQPLWSNELNACVGTGLNPNYVVSAPSTTPAGTAFAFSVTANNPSGNQGTDIAYVGTAHFTSSDPEAVLPADFTYLPEDLGTASFNATLDSMGPQTITATDTLNGNIVGTSDPIGVSAAADVTSLSTTCPTTFVENQSIALAAVVSGLNPTGSVTFSDGATVFCDSVALTSGTASCQTPALMIQGGGTSYVYNVTANYSGDGANSPSSSLSLPITVLQASDVAFRNGLEANLAGCPAD